MQISTIITLASSESRDNDLDVITNLDFLSIKLEGLGTSIDHSVSQPTFANFFWSMRRNKSHILFENGMSEYGASDIFFSNFTEIFTMRALKIVAFC